MIELFAAGGEERLRAIVDKQDREEVSRSLRQIKATQAATAAHVAALDARARLHLFLDWFDVL